jgi:hypothetical protein
MSDPCKSVVFDDNRGTDSDPDKAWALDVTYLAPDTCSVNRMSSRSKEPKPAKGQGWLSRGKAKLGCKSWGSVVNFLWCEKP